MAADGKINGKMSAAEQKKRPGLTDQQRRALETRNVSIALSAGAGCGKTFVLTRRFLNELTPDAGGAACSRLSQIVAITFTERAAREMRERIGAGCRQKLRECPANQVDYWLNLVRELDSARISTIHSFCGSLLRSHAVEAGVDPRFRVFDGAQAATLLCELTDDVLRHRLADCDETILQLLTRFSLGKLHEIIAELLSRRQEIDWAAWTAESADQLVARWEVFWRTTTLPLALRKIVESPDAKKVLEIAGGNATTHPAMQERFAALRGELTRLAEMSQGRAAASGTASPADCLKAIREAAIVQGVSKKYWDDADVYERYKNAAKSLRDAIDGAQKHMSFDIAASRPAAETALAALRVAADVAEQYDAKKREIGAMDFDDLLIHARRLLVGDEHKDLRARLASQIHLLLVDEFQDTDPLQVELVRSLCNDDHLRGKLFLVGDHKQSIYRFRGADPRVFRDLRESFPEEGRLPLSLNFRSQPAILEFVNTLFCEELAPDYEPLRPSRPQVTPLPAVEFLWANEDGEASGDGDCSAPAFTPGERGVISQTLATQSPGLSVSPSAMSGELSRSERLRRMEADWIARRIRGMIESGEKIVWDKAAAESGGPAARPVRPGDIAILFRAMTNVEYYEAALQRYGIDYYLVGGRAFYSQQEIYDLLNLLRSLHSDCDAVSLAGVLRSPMFGLFDETLFWLTRDEDGRLLDGGLSAGLFASPVHCEIVGEQRQRVEFAAATIGELRSLKDRLSVADLIQESLRRTCYDAAMLAEFLGERKLANLHKLIDQARGFDRAGVFTLADFITQLSEFVARQPDEAMAATQPETTNVVRLMSIHQSKGLEFPVVVVPDVSRPRRFMPPPIAFSPELGPAFREESAVTGYDLLMAMESEEDRREHSRLFYVAATRAADYLILSAGVDAPGDVKGPWMELLADRFDVVSGEPKETRRESCGEKAGSRLAPVSTPGAIVDGGQWAVGGAKPQAASSNPQSLIPNPSSPPSAKLPLRVTLERPVIASKPKDSRLHCDLTKMIADANALAVKGQGSLPAYVEPVARDASARRQYSFSRLSGMLHAKNDDADAGRMDGERSDEPLDARGLGTLAHAALEELDFSRPEDVDACVRRLAEQHLTASEQPDELSDMIERFLKSERAEKLRAATAVHRELEFLLAWPPAGNKEIADKPDASDGNKKLGRRYLQGFLDCLYCDADGGWHIVDYKTNRVKPGRVAAAAKPYEMQMLVYALAAETILKRPPVELTLYFLRPGEEYSFAWDADARRRVVELVGHALP